MCGKNINIPVIISRKDQDDLIDGLSSTVGQIVVWVNFEPSPDG
jgi:hypothetical protein